MSLGINYEMYQRGPHVGTPVENVENSFYVGQPPLESFRGGTIDGASRDTGNSPDTTILRPGLLLGQVYSTGKLKQWSPTATDGTQFIFGILDNPAVKMTQGGTDYDRFRGQIMVKGQVNPARLLVPGQASFGITGTAYEYLIRQQMQAAGFTFYEDPASSGLLGFGTPFLGGFRMVQAKTADYTVKPYESGTLFTNRGASGTVIFTLPASPVLGLSYGFYCVANQTLTVASAAGDDMVAINDAAADSVSFATSSLKIGGMFELYYDGTGWLTRVSAGQTSDGTTSGQLVTVAT